MLIDIHNHVLPGIDDGSPNLSVSINMIRKASEQGITDIVNTVHFQHPKMDMVPVKIDDIRSRIENLQKEIFSAIGLPEKVAAERFQFLLRAFRFGAPPHAGFAVGLDRLYNLMFGTHSIRDVIAFPKTATTACPLTEAPSKVDAEQLLELGIIQKHEK